MKYKKSSLSPREARGLERLFVEAERIRAHQDYLAMMCDVELPDMQQEVETEEPAIYERED